MASRENRVKKLEEGMSISDYGLRVIVPFGCFYNEEGAEPYWTDEAVKGMEAANDDKPYRKVKHPDGKKATIGVFG